MPERKCPLCVTIGRTQRLSSLSSGLPFSFVPDHGVEDGEDFTGYGDEGDHFWLTRGEQAGVELVENGVVTAGDESCHEQGGAG